MSGFASKKLGQSDPHEPAAGEVFGAPVHVVGGEAEAPEDALRLGFDRVPAARLEAVLDAAILRHESIAFRPLRHLRHLVLEHL